MATSDGRDVGASDRARLVEITLDDSSVGTTNPNIEHEREVAIFDILDGNSFALEGNDEGPTRCILPLSTNAFR